MQYKEYKSQKWTNNIYIIWLVLKYTKRWATKMNKIGCSKMSNAHLSLQCGLLQACSINTGDRCSDLYHESRCKV